MAGAVSFVEPPHLLLEALDPLLLLGEAAADVLETILELLVRFRELLVHLPQLLATPSRSFEVLAEPTGHLFDVAVEIASVLLEAALEIVLKHAGGRALMSGEHHPILELRPRAAALGPQLMRFTGVLQRPHRRLTLRRGPTETGFKAIEITENLIELLCDVGERIKGNGSHRRRREWGWDTRRKRRLELGVRLPGMMRPLRRLRALHRLHVPGDDPFETFDRFEGEACGSTGALLQLAVRPDLDIKGEHLHLRRQDNGSPLPRSERPFPAPRGPGLLSLIRLRGGIRRSSSRFSSRFGPRFGMLEEGDELGDRVVGGLLKPPRGHGCRFRLRCRRDSRDHQSRTSDSTGSRDRPTEGDAEGIDRATHGKSPDGQPRGRCETAAPARAWIKRRECGEIGNGPGATYPWGIMSRPAEPPHPDDAVLVDFGRGRRLERLAGILVDRPLPQARLSRRLPDVWAESSLSYTGGPEGESRISAGEPATPLPRGWRQFRPLPDPWRVAIPLHATTLHLEVRPAASGQTGLFLEQAPQWIWLERVTPRGARILSLFAHSGAATLALAAAGAEVVHVDASRQAIGLARRNAEASGLATAPIRFVCEDARVFVQRELRRGSRYDGVVLDPPSWGHGPKGQAFAIDRDLPLLLDDLAGLIPAPAAGPLLLSCHSAGWTAHRLAEALAVVAGGDGQGITSGPLTCSDAAGRSLEFGAHARLAPRKGRGAP